MPSEVMIAVAETLKLTPNIRILAETPARNPDESM